MKFEMKYIPLIQIPEPCHQNWEEMNVVEKGKFCSNCNKVVTDFVIMSDAQIVDFFKNNPQNVCGRFNEDQLQRPLFLPKKQIIKWNYFTASIISFLLNSKLIAQVKTISNDTISKNNITNSFHSEKNIANKITGHITDEKGYSIAGATVVLKGTNNGAVTDDEGFFVISNYPTNIIKKQLLIQSIGFKNVEIELRLYQKIILENDIESLNEVCVTAPISKSIRRSYLGGAISINASVLNRNKNSFLYKLVKPVINAYQNITDTKSIKVFPNPAIKNSIIKIQIYTTGSYIINLINSEAKIISSKIITTTNKKLTTDFSLPSSLTSGIYFIALVNIDTKRLETEKLLIE